MFSNFQNYISENFQNLYFRKFLKFIFFKNLNFIFQKKKKSKFSSQFVSQKNIPKKNISFKNKIYL